MATCATVINKKEPASEGLVSSDLSYISLFSGIGGLEHPTTAPIVACDIDSACVDYLSNRYPGSSVVDDVLKLTSPPSADLVVGGWPCQDISSAGKGVGLSGERSGLFFSMLDIAKRSGAHTIIGENVPNLRKVNRGKDFNVMLESLRQAGFPFISWRTLNARNFGLPQERKRLFIVASKDLDRVMALHTSPDTVVEPEQTLDSAYGFYWTGGARSICFSKGYTPTLKVGATDNNGRAPVAIFYKGQVRKLTPSEFLRLQGFEPQEFRDYTASTILRMAGNAVALPVGQFVISSVTNVAASNAITTGYGTLTEDGYFDGEMIWSIGNHPLRSTSNLHEFLCEDANESLSAQAAAGLIVRSIRAGKTMPLELFDSLIKIASENRIVRPSRSNSFEALQELGESVNNFRTNLKALQPEI